jgi:hypothetical protein
MPLGSSIRRTDVATAYTVYYLLFPNDSVSAGFYPASS